MDKYFLKSTGCFLILLLINITSWTQSSLDLVNFSNELYKTNYLQDYLTQNGYNNSPLCFYSLYNNLDWYIQSESDKDSVAYYMSKYENEGDLVFSGGALFLGKEYDQFFIIHQFKIKNGEFKCILRAYSYGYLEEKNKKYGLFIIKGSKANDQWIFSSFKEKKYTYKPNKRYWKDYWLGLTQEEANIKYEEMKKKGKIID